MRRIAVFFLLTFLGFSAAEETAEAQVPRQPKVAPGPNEPDWVALLDHLYGLKLFDDLSNPAANPVDATPGTFRKAGPGPVRFTPVLALGLETVNRGGWYRPGPKVPLEKTTLWSYRHKHTTADFQGPHPGEWKIPEPPPLSTESSTTFDPGEAPFGLWVANDGLPQSDAYSEPKAVAAHNPRLARQPYKAMIYPMKDPSTSKLIPHSYLIGWEYSTNDDFQDIVARVDNVSLIPHP